MNYGASPDIETVSQSGTYWIDAFAPAGTAPKALKVLKGVDAAGTRTWYYLEARVKYGFDGGIVPGVVVHTGSDAVGNSSYQIDLDPETSTFDSMLDPSQTYTDAPAGLSVKTVWADATGAMVDVTYAGAPCTAGTPAVAFRPHRPSGRSPARRRGSPCR